MEHAQYSAQSERRHRHANGHLRVLPKGCRLGLAVAVSLGLLCSSPAAAANGDVSHSVADQPETHRPEPAVSEKPACPDTVCRPSFSHAGIAGFSAPSAVGATALQEALVPNSRFARFGKRGLGMRLLQGVYATVSMRPNQPLDPVSMRTADRVSIGVRCMIKF